ncbi:MAG TPA: tRNA (N(6)-L-threonylcarbamoyladenosine(37)-C(2))-methylthiotransferase MtaB [Clostridia bacterium]|jgi:threonylcarbamoyladenosine tRNA methylthiotransferase MtaB|nr:tRNA (N(6)-L-threonylcarbamoyladenosine(37)-C(2))-methylthiotransferase MtaB [Clostridia bacterium]
MAKVAFYTLGCKVNQYDTEAMAELFKKKGYEIEDFHNPADVYIVNSCTVTNEGDRKSRQMIRRAIKQNPNAIVAVTGCYAQIAGKKLSEIPGLDLVVGTQERKRIVELVEEVAERKKQIFWVSDIMETKEFEPLEIEEFGEKTRAYVKIQEGCNQFCTYCIIPYVRGPVRSRPLKEIVAEVERLTAKGYREIVLTGIHLGLYGADFKDGTDLADVILAISKVAGLVRIRLSSIDSNDITNKLIEAMLTVPKFCRHLHIPLQSGDNEILRAMNRHYTTEEYKQLIDVLREKIPQIAITTDLIVGFPGEKEEHFRNTCNFVKQIGFSRMHIFSYSPRKGTPAADFPNQISKQIKEERSKKMHMIAEEMAFNYANSYLNKEVEVLVESRTCSGRWQGLTDTYLRVEFASDEALEGELVRVKIFQREKDILIGKLIV